MLWRKQTQELGIDETSWFGSLASVGALVGTSVSWIVTRWLSSRQGLILCSSGLLTGWALIFSAAQVWDSSQQTDNHHANFQASCLPLIYPGLLVLGLSCGLSNPLSAIYITEIAGMANKGIVTSMFNFNLTFGILLTNVVGSLAG